MPAAIPDEAELRLLSPSEIEFLKMHCPESTEIVTSGVAIINGFIIRPPILVSSNRDRVHLNGLQVDPPELRPKYYAAKKIVDRLQAEYLERKRRGTEDPLKSVLDQARELTRTGRIENFAVTEGDHPQLSVTAEGHEWHWVLDTCSSLTTAKRHYIIEQLLWSYTARKNTDSGAAIEWLRARLSDLKQMEVISTYRFHKDEETVFVRYDCALTDNAFGFFDPRTRRALDYEKSWKAKRNETVRRQSSVAQGLGSGMLLLHSFAFEKSAANDSEALGKLERARHGVLPAGTAESLRVTLGLTQKQAEELLNEVR